MVRLARLAPFILLVECSGSERSGTGGTSNDGVGETGRLMGMTAAINDVRRGVATTVPIPPLTWSGDIAAAAQAYANSLASSGCNLVHSGSPYGENLASFSGQQATAAQVVAAWADEGACYTYGTFDVTDSCPCGSCGHYTQLVWRDTTQVGCGEADCAGGGEVWVCNFEPPGNVVGETPY